MLLTATVVLLFVSLFIPWLTSNILSQRVYSLIEITSILIQPQLAQLGITNNNNNSTNVPSDPVLSDLTKVYENSSFALYFSVIIYPISIAVLSTSIIYALLAKSKKNMSRGVHNWTKILLIGGVLATVASVAWIYSIQSFKTQFSEHADISGGIIGAEWKGKASVLIDRMIMIGFGPFIAIISGIIALFTFFVERTYRNDVTKPISY